MSQIFSETPKYRFFREIRRGVNSRESRRPLLDPTRVDSTGNTVNEVRIPMTPLQSEPESSTNSKSDVHEANIGKIYSMKMN